MNIKLFKILVAITSLTSIFTPAFSQTALSSTNTDYEGIVVTIEEPVVQSTLLPDADEYFVIDFEDRDLNTSEFSKTHDGTTYTYDADLRISDHNQWGGANESKFITQKQLESIRSYRIKVDKNQSYFGFWWSAGDAYNKITFKKNGKEVASFKTSDLVDFIEASAATNTADYYGNPNPSYLDFDGGHKNEPYAFVNVFFQNEPYDEIVVATLTEGGAAFESDNHTFAAKKQEIRGTIVLNSAPTANGDTATTIIGQPVTIDVLDNDTDPEGDNLTITGVSNVIGGTAKVEDNKIIYTANLIPGTYSLNYTIEDDKNKTSLGTVTVNVMGYPD